MVATEFVDFQANRLLHSVIEGLGMKKNLVYHFDQFLSLCSKSLLTCFSVSTPILVYNECTFL